MQKHNPPIARDRLKLLRKSRMLTQKEVAKRGNFKLTSNYRYYENTFRGIFLPHKLEEQLIRAMTGLGNPPITEQEIMELFYTGRNNYPHFNNVSKPLIYDGSPKSGIVGSKAAKDTDSIDINKLAPKVFPPLSRQKIETCLGEAQIMEKHGVKYGQVIPIEDDAMAPELIPGFRVICDAEAELENGCIVFAKIYNQKGLVCRRYTISLKEGEDKVIRLTPLDTSFDSYLIDKDQQGHIVGRAVYAFRYL